MKVRQIILLALVAVVFSTDLQADIICQSYCNAWGMNFCAGDSTVSPTQGCMVWVDGCMSISAPACAGDPGCGLDAVLCPNNQM
jgi:hypothetical protein